ncbi:MAG TPA: histidine kinase dimerization/phospho-acceptor domain-containing protein, partial [Nannocystaceae bacterium]|nr:histidine kinase dimerization/phospho-acceptor domain-containing protein [Nannocystaceae bacterium]
MHVLFAHGLESGPWGRKSHALREAGHDVVAPDCRTLDLSARVTVLLESLRVADPLPTVVGSSFGGIAALLAVVWAAREGLVVPGLVLCAPALAVPVPTRWQAPLAPPCPTVILHGRNDTVVPIDDSRRFADEHGVELVELDDDHPLAGSIDRVLAAVERVGRDEGPRAGGLGRSFHALIETIAHDLRNPLGTVQLTAELARASSSEVRATKQAQRIIDNVARMVGVLDQAQQYAALLAQPRPSHRPGPSDATAALDLVVQALRPEDRLLVEPTVTGDAMGPWDPELLRLVLAELVDNALGYRRDAGPVHVRIDGSIA